MKKGLNILSVLLFASIAFTSLEVNAGTKPTKNEATTRSDAVIFKIHDISPTLEDGIVTGCDFTITYYNRTLINFRTFTMNLEWNDPVSERFQFDHYMEKFLTEEEIEKQKAIEEAEKKEKQLKTEITVNAFGADKQISIRSHVNNEKCYLMLSEASYKVSPCEVARNIDTANIDQKDCSNLFQLVNVSNPEYFGQFQKLSNTDIETQNTSIQMRELSDIDDIINKIVDNLGASDKTLTHVN